MHPHMSVMLAGKVSHAHFDRIETGKTGRMTRSSCTMAKSGKLGQAKAAQKQSSMRRGRGREKLWGIRNVAGAGVCLLLSFGFFCARKFRIGEKVSGVRARRKKAQESFSFSPLLGCFLSIQRFWTFATWQRVDTLLAQRVMATC